MVESAPSVIDRTRLLDALRAAGGRRLILIHGPAGFGKTTLAAQWARELRSTGTPVAWLTVGPDDDNVVWFLTHLVEAVRRVRPELARRELGALLEERASDPRSVLSALIEEIHATGRPIALVLDDWHRVEGRDTRAVVAHLLEHGCRHLQLVVTARGRTGLSLSSLSADRELFEIDTAALRFDAREASAFLVGASELPLGAEEVTRVWASTEGWPAGLRLAQLSLSGCEDPAPFIDNLSGRQHVIGEYLTENVLDSLDPALLDFLMATSLPTRICAGLAAALSGRTDSQAMLEQIADRNLFLHRMDGDGGWFRYHRLFADHLQRRLSYWDPDRVRGLHLCASDWLARHGLLTEAVDHALAAPEPERAVDLVESQSVHLVNSSRMATMLGLMAKLPVPLTESRPRLQLCVAWANCGLNNTASVQAAVRRAYAAIEDGDLTPTQETEYRVEAELVTATEQLHADQLEEPPKLLPGHIDHLPNPVLALAVAGISAAAALNRFDYAGVRQWHSAAVRYARELPAFALVHSNCIAGMAAFEELDIAAAATFLTHAAAVPDADSEAATHAAALAGALLGDLRYAQGRLAEADELLTAATAGPRRVVSADVMLAAYGTAARVAALRGDRDRAIGLLDAGERTARDGALPRLAARITNERVRLGLPLAEHVRSALGRQPANPAQPVRVRAAVVEADRDSAIRLLLAEGSPSATTVACEHARNLVRDIDSHPRPRDLAAARLLHACCLWALGDRRAARTAAAPALDAYRRHGLLRLARDAGPGITEVIADLERNPLPH
ncbi:AAA family ATPase [Nocardia sp. BMG111209]|uniref:AAA family ATPase n=1 Tax=Nocardia sp. BMG111209 TaxID=1160137 RepID=UPI00036B726D|nr:AAA family ATPase [Nocardia sp. BMG111209]